MKIGIVNDSLIAVEAQRRILQENGRHEVIWTAGNGAEAVAQCNALCPDLILMDLMMPVMDGVEATRRIMRSTPCAILIVTASVTGNASMVFEAMGAGALDAVATPVLGRQGIPEAGRDLLRKIEIIGKLIGSDRPEESASVSAPGRPRKESCLVAIGCSTGGPQALTEVLAHFPAGTQASFAVIQHMDRKFTAGLAAWIKTQIHLPVRIIEQGERPKRGLVSVPQTDHHVVLTNQGCFAYTKEPSDIFYHPSVDVFFDSIARYWHGRIIGILLTGMGRDGANGLLTLRRQGHLTIAQDRDSCVVYGMPKMAAELDAAQLILPLKDIGPTVAEVLKQKDLLGHG